MISSQRRDFGLTSAAARKCLLAPTILLSLALAASLSADTLSWTRATADAPWVGQWEFTSAVFNSELWAMGGTKDPYHSFLNSVWHSSDGANWTEETVPAPWPGRYAHRSVVFDNKLWVIGGSGGGWLNDVWYSPNGVDWTCATPSAPWSARAYHTVAVIDNKLWVMGGYSGSGLLNDVWYSSNGADWTQATASASWPARYGHTAVVFDNKLWVMGGARVESPHGGDWLHDAWYSSNGTDWTPATDSAPWSGRYCHASVVFANAMWVLGGYGDDSLRNDAWYSSNGADWTRACSSAAWSARNLYTDVDSFDNKLWVIGGCGVDSSGNSLPRTDVWWTQGLPGVQEGNAVINTRFALSNLGPNPFRDQATIRCEAPRGEPITLRIYSSSGALVKVLAQDVVARGPQRFEWNGTNETNVRVPLGTYFVRLTAGDYVGTEKLVLQH